MEPLKPRTPHSPLVMEKKRWALPIAVISLVCAFLLVTSLNMGLLNSPNSIDSIIAIFPVTSSSDEQPPQLFVEPKLPPSPPPPKLLVEQPKLPPSPIPELFVKPKLLPLLPPKLFVEPKLRPSPPPPSGPPIPRLAYLVSGSKGDLNRLWRTLHALYHPRNLYVLHLDLESPAAERLELVTRVAEDKMFAKVKNVFVTKKANMVTYRGPTMVASTLHACAILLKKSKNWDWFINLSASDYPLVTQDDLLHAFSSLPRNLNFIEHTSRLGWKEGQRAQPLIVDPGLFKSVKSDVFWVTQRRELPTAFKLFTGSAWTVLSREFVEYCVWGWDNLPRILLMYYTNFISSPEGYFQTVICNAPEFTSTVVNHDLHYIAWDVPPKQHPHTLTLDDAPKMIGSNAPFARKFDRDDPLLDKIDAELLGGRSNHSFVRGGWCEGSSRGCSKVGDMEKLKPGPGAKRLKKLLRKLVWSKGYTRNQCK